MPGERRNHVLVAVAVVLGVWLVLRTFVPTNAWVRVVEFPLIFALVGFAGARYLRRRDVDRTAPELPWVRHEQVVRRLPDPVVGGMADALSAWTRDGTHPEAAARVVAKATGASEDDVLSSMQGARSRAQRRRLIADHLSEPGA